MSTVIRIYPDDWANLNKDQCGQKYQPGNGTEGEIFLSEWCGNCQRDKSMRDGVDLSECDDDERCDLIAYSFLDINDPLFPKEWIYGEDGQPKCTAFIEKGTPIPPEKDIFTIDMFPENLNGTGN